ncbi:hypothetical protein HBI56_179780 [Parastagonospora nodorum]|uniref:Uncharacterized protein n=2 Tax=Phaeosphaeria nodorum (strain SN15 / ATCC MYA-4574 / FGSC 10173) TaxID=321614 RepID=A0A7U2F9D9_PHANO|nr:hypothetical protein SNOG_15281 [Parastagonospora nodorum SN15]KAH3907598.1 hypothetical protein HBH56_185210 [Parastagonospora nodorum]EAT77214.1 hypothetical protein SNOG_15281 [Parastagonospora nodorum SN15]KAH3925301.1 hypothetical protein HBH54_183360 [Parastagonospora nodorum]KAH3940552.1 hypothetical protein HBH53_214920 [Parastagonospora nodorum]KAH3992109.1 hypothetical protein HBI10_221420 [Parastagonospora nodorum]
MSSLNQKRLTLSSWQVNVNVCRVNRSLQLNESSVPIRSNPASLMTSKPRKPFSSPSVTSSTPSRSALSLKQLTDRQDDGLGQIWSRGAAALPRNTPQSSQCALQKFNLCDSATYSMLPYIIQAV